MFLLDYKNQNIYLYSGKIIKIQGNFNEIFEYIKEKYLKIEQEEICYINNFELIESKNRNYTKIFSTYKGIIYKISGNLINEVGINKIIINLFGYSINSDKQKVLKNIEVYGENFSISLVKEQNIQTIEDLIKESFLVMEKKNHYYTSFIKFSYGLGNYRDTDIVDNTVKGIDKNRELSLNKAISEFIERVSCSLYTKDFLKQTEIEETKIYRKRWIEKFDIGILKYQKIQELITKKIFFIPEDFLYYPYYSEIGANFSDSNGVVTHIDLERAILGGILELIERDCFVLMWLLKKGFYYINNRSLSKKVQKDFYQVEKEFGIKIYTFILKLDNPIPVSMSIFEKSGKIIVGLGADFKIETSIHKSFMETLSMINYLENTDKPKKSENDILNHILYYSKNNHFGNIEFLLSQKPKNINSIQGLFQSFGNYKELIKYYEKYEIYFYIYEYKNILNNIFKRKTVRILGDLLPIYFGKEVPKIITNSKRFIYWKNKYGINNINKNLHPFG